MIYPLESRSNFNIKFSISLSEGKKLLSDKNLFKFSGKILSKTEIKLKAVFKGIPDNIKFSIIALLVTSEFKCVFNNSIILSLVV